MKAHAVSRRPAERWKPYLFLLPMLVFAAAFVYYPFLMTAADSFSIVNAKGQTVGFAGLSQFAYVFSRREFTAALVNTLKLSLLNVPITVALTMALGWLCSKPVRLSPVLESVFSLPIAVAMSSITLVFKVLLNPTVGIVNHALGLSLGWYEDRHTALYGILLLTVWMGVGFNFMLFLSAFRSIPKELTEAAALEGAGQLRMLWYVQLPLTVPTVVYVVCTNLIQAMMTNGPVLILTQGGPSRSTTTLIYLMYTMGYASSNYSAAAVVSIVTFALALLFTFLLFLREKRQVDGQ